MRLQTDPLPTVSLFFAAGAPLSRLQLDAVDALTDITVGPKMDAKGQVPSA